MSWDDNYTKMAKMDTFFVMSAYIIGASVDNYYIDYCLFLHHSLKM